MKPVVWLAGIVLLFAFMFPNGVPLPSPPKPGPAPVVPEPVTPAVTDPEIVRILAAASPADKARVRGVYSGMATVLTRDNKLQLVKNSEQFALWQESCLKLAIDESMRGKLAGLDVAIEAVFARKFGEDLKRDDKEVVAFSEAIRNQAIAACELIAASAQ